MSNIQMVDDCIPTTKVYRSTMGISTDFVKLVMDEPKLELDYEHIKGHRIEDLKYNPPMSERTSFKEISVISPKEFIGPRLHNVIESPIEKIEIGVSDAAEGFIEALFDFFYEEWNSNYPHIILHSAGFDSRIISSLLMRLREREGRDWLGDILFLCHEPECESFKSIMNLQGWRDDEYHCFREGRTLTDYFVDITDFDKCWEWSGGCNHIWSGFFHIMISDILERGLIQDRSDNIEVVTGFSGNSLLDRPWNDMLHCKRGYYFEHPYIDADMSLYRELYGHRHSIMNTNYRRYLDPISWYKVFKYSISLSNTGIPGIRKAIMKHLCPGVEKIPRSDIAVSRAYKMSNETINRMIDRYNKSTLATIFPHDILAETLPMYSPLYSLASLCEKLVEVGKL